MMFPYRVGVITFEMSLLAYGSSLKLNMTKLGAFIANGLDINFSQVCMLNFTSEGNHYHIRWDIYPVDSASYITSTQAKGIILQLTGHHLKFLGNFGSYELVEWNVERQNTRKPQFLAIVIGSFAILAIILSLIGIWFLQRRQKQALRPYEPVDSIVVEQELQPLRTQLTTCTQLRASIIFFAAFPSLLRKLFQVFMTKGQKIANDAN